MKSIINQIHTLKLTSRLLLAIGGWLLLFTIVSNQQASASHDAATADCGPAYARGLIWALDNTETIAQEAALPPEERREPFGNPDRGQSGTRAQINVNISSSYTGGDPCAESGTGQIYFGGQLKVLPGTTFSTPSCPVIGSCSGDIPFIDINSASDASRIRLNPPSTVNRGGRILTHIATTWEDGQGTRTEPWTLRSISMNRNFPTATQINQMATSPQTGHPDRKWYRLLIHYADCRDPGVAALFPIRCGVPDDDDDDEEEEEEEERITFSVSNVRSNLSINPSLENPETGDFRSSFQMNISGSDDVNRISGINSSMRYYIRHHAGGTTNIGTRSSSSASRGTNVRRAMGVDLSSYNIVVGDRICTILTVSPTSGEVDGDGQLISSSGRRSSGESCLTIVALPYVSAFGADVVAGSGFVEDNSSCGSDEDDDGFIQASFSDGRGSGAQFAVQAMTQINGFASAKMRTVAPIQPRGLTFANTGMVLPFGGEFGRPHCVNDWYAQRPPDSELTTRGNINAVLSSESGSGAYELNASVLGGAGNVEIPDRRRIIVYVGNSLQIDRNFVFSGADDWSSEEDIPSFYTIVQGDIYIDSSVERLDGVYFATGNIYTCASGRRPVNIMADLDDALNQCGNQLTVNGALIADNVYFNRVFSTQSSNEQDEFPYGDIKSCRVGGADSDGPVNRRLCAAEVINYSPELFLAPPPLQRESSVGGYDAILSLPPVL